MALLIILAIIGFIVLWFFFPRATLVAMALTLVGVTGFWEKYFSSHGAGLAITIVSIFLIIVGFVIDCLNITNIIKTFKEE